MPGRRPALFVALVLAVLFVTAAPVGAHVEVDPSEVGPGTIVDFTLDVENERDTAGVVKVEAQVPDGIPVVGAENTGWTLEEGDGIITWSRPEGPAGQSPELAVRLGPLPGAEGQVQLKVIVTYSDGSEDAWIEDWPSGAPEPESPGPVIRLVTGAPGTVPEQASTTSAPATSTTASSTEATTSTTEAPATSSTDDDDGSAAPWIIGVVVIGVAAAAAIYALARRSRRTSGPDQP